MYTKVQIDIIKSLLRDSLYKEDIFLDPEFVGFNDGINKAIELLDNIDLVAE